MPSTAALYVSTELGQKFTDKSTISVGVNATNLFVSPAVVRLVARGVAGFRASIYGAASAASMGG